MDDLDRRCKLGVELLEARCLPSASVWGLYVHPSGVVTADASTVRANTLTQTMGSALSASQPIASFDADDTDDGPAVDGPEPADLLPNRSVPINPTQERGDPDDDAGPTAESAQFPAMTLEQNQADSGVGLVPQHGVPPTSPASIGLASIAGLTGEIVSGTVGGSNQSPPSGFYPALAAREKTLEVLVLELSRDLSVELSRPPAHDRVGRWNSHLPELIEASELSGRHSSRGLAPATRLVERPL